MMSRESVPRDWEGYYPPIPLYAWGREISEWLMTAGSAAYLGAVAPTLQPPAVTSPQPRLTVDLDPKGSAVTFDNVRHPAMLAGATFVNFLLAAKGDYVSGRMMDEQAEELRGCNISRVYKKLPAPIRDLIESKRPVGYRLKPGRWS
jgi:hypothetical protein